MMIKRCEFPTILSIDESIWNILFIYDGTEWDYHKISNPSYTRYLPKSIIFYNVGSRVKPNQIMQI